MAVITAPAAWLLSKGSPASFWSEHAALLVPFALVLFLLLESAYLGSFGRTPGLRLAGLRIVDETGRVPTYRKAVLHTLMLPLFLVPVLDHVSRTRPVSEP
jgi:uncharacterized RDD family membrane protein YckC